MLEAFGGWAELRAAGSSALAGLPAVYLQDTLHK